MLNRSRNSVIFGLYVGIDLWEVYTTSTVNANDLYNIYIGHHCSDIAYNVALPSSAFSESSCLFFNILGMVQRTVKAVQPFVKEHDRLHTTDVVLCSLWHYILSIITLPIDLTNTKDILSGAVIHSSFRLYFPYSIGYVDDLLVCTKLIIRATGHLPGIVYALQMRDTKATDCISRSGIFKYQSKRTLVRRYSVYNFEGITFNPATIKQHIATLDETFDKYHACGLSYTEMSNAVDAYISLLFNSASRNKEYFLKYIFIVYGYTSADFNALFLRVPELLLDTAYIFKQYLIVPPSFHTFNRFPKRMLFDMDFVREGHLPLFSPSRFYLCRARLKRLIVQHEEYGLSLEELSLATTYFRTSFLMVLRRNNICVQAFANTFQIPLEFNNVKDWLREEWCAWACPSLELIISIFHLYAHGVDKYKDVRASLHCAHVIFSTWEWPICIPDVVFAGLDECSALLSEHYRSGWTDTQFIRAVCLRSELYVRYFKSYHELDMEYARIACGWDEFKYNEVFSRVASALLEIGQVIQTYVTTGFSKEKRTDLWREAKVHNIHGGVDFLYVFSGRWRPWFMMFYKYCIDSVLFFTRSLKFELLVMVLYCYDMWILEFVRLRFYDKRYFKLKYAKGAGGYSAAHIRKLRVWSYMYLKATWLFMDDMVSSYDSWRAKQ